MQKYIVKQESEVDCGAACLLSIIKYYGGYVPLEIIKVDTLTDNYGTNFFHLKEAAIGYGFNSKGLKVDNLKKVKLPCIAQVIINNFNHFVVIYKYDKTVTFMDPSQGIVQLSIIKFNQIFKGHVLELIPGGKIIKYENKRLFYQNLKAIFKVHYRTLLSLLGLSVPIVGLTLLSSFNIILILKYKLIIIAMLIVLLNLIISYFKNIIVSSLNKKINLAIIKIYLNHIFNLPLYYLQLKKTGEIINKVHDLYNIKDIFSKTLVDAILNVLILIGTLGMLLVLEFKLTIVIIAFSFVYFIMSFYLNKGLYLQMMKIMASDNTFMDLVIEYLHKIKTIKNLGISYFGGKLDASLETTITNKHCMDKKSGIVHLIQSFSEELLFLIILIFGFYNQVDYVQMMVYYAVYNYYLQSLRYIINLLPLMMYFKGVFVRVGSIFELLTERKPKISTKPFNGLRINHLTYSYNKLDYIFTNLNIEIKKGEKVLINGTNGSGKSTLLDIIAGNINSFEGSIEGNYPINYLPQGAELFSGSILENIILELTYDEEKFKQVEKLTCLKEIINNKSGGYNTHIYSANISGGEKQRIILARHLYRDFELLLLDEALSQVATEQRNKILNLLWQTYPDKTIVSVSHYQEAIGYHRVINLTARKETYVDKQ